MTNRIIEPELAGRVRQHRRRISTHTTEMPGTRLFGRLKLAAAWIAILVSLLVGAAVGSFFGTLAWLFMWECLESWFGQG